MATRRGPKGNATSRQRKARGMASQMGKGKKPPKTIGGVQGPKNPSLEGPVGGGVPPTGDEPEEGRPPQPDQELPDGWTWGWNDELGQWIPQVGDEEEEEEEEDEDQKRRDRDKLEAREALLDRLTSFLQDSELDTDDMRSFMRRAISEDWSESEIYRELRRQPDYLKAYPENAMRKKNGLNFRPEGEIRAYRDTVRSLFRTHGKGNPSNHYIAEGFALDLSPGEVEHRLKIAGDVEKLGPYVKAGMQSQGYLLSDEDLWDFFDPEKDTKDWTEAYRNARLTYQPIAFGLDPRSKAELDALNLLGIGDDEAIQRYQQMGLDKPRFERVKSIQDLLISGLPEDFGGFMSKVPNELQRDAILFQSGDALAELQNLWMQEAARNKSGGGVAGGGAGFLPAGQR